MNTNCCNCNPTPQKVYDSFEDAVKASNLVYLKPGQIYIAFYNNSKNEFHILMAIGNILPTEGKLFMTDMGGDLPYLEQIDKLWAAIGEKASASEVNILQEQVNNIQSNVEEIIESSISEEEIQELFNERYIVTQIPCIGGSVNIPEGKSIVEIDDEVTVSYVVKPNYEFRGWFLNGVYQHSENEFTFQAPGNTTITCLSENSEDKPNGIVALFLNTIACPIVYIPEEAGIDNNQINVYVNGDIDNDGTIISGSTVSVKAVPIRAYNFKNYIITAKDPRLIVNWSDFLQYVDPLNPNVITVPGEEHPELNLGAVCTPIQVAGEFELVKINIVATHIDGQCECGNVAGTALGENAPRRGETWTVYAEPKTGYRFVGWFVSNEAAEPVSTDETYSFTVEEESTAYKEEDKEIKLYAKFEPAE